MFKKRFYISKPHSISYGAMIWWEKVDSNHRSWKQQIYSLPPLAAREFSHIIRSCGDKSWWTDLNPRPADYKSAALPTELHQRVPVLVTKIILTHHNVLVNRIFQFLLFFHTLSKNMIEATGLEPAASWSQTKHSTKLSYTSKCLISNARLLYPI